MVKYPQFLFTHVKSMIHMMKWTGEDLVTMSARRDKEGFEKYGNKWERPAKEECREEFSDAYNYIQWTYLQGDIDEDQRDYLLSLVLHLDHQFRLFAWAPPLAGSPKAKFRIPKGFKPVRTVRWDE